MEIRRAGLGSFRSADGEGPLHAELRVVADGAEQLVAAAGQAHARGALPALEGGRAAHVLPAFPDVDVVGEAAVVLEGDRELAWLLDRDPGRVEGVLAGGHAQRPA